MPRVVKIEGMEMRNGLSDPDSGQTEGGVGVLQRPETSREVRNHPICPRCVEIKKEMDASGGPDWPFRGPGSR